MLSGKPIGEPVAIQDALMMNTCDEIRGAIADFTEGRFGAIPSPHAAQ